jgi:uncharacterized protein involved in exopolysaccharide biosynthesis
MIEDDSCVIESELSPGGLPRPGDDRRRSEVGIIDVLIHLAQRKWLVVKITGLAVVAGVAFALLQPTRFTATTKLMPPQQTPSSASLFMNQLASSGGGTMMALTGAGLGLKNPNDIYIGMLMSRPIADALIQRFNLQQSYHARTMTQARRALTSNTMISSDKKGFIVVSVVDKDGKRAADLANAYADELRKLSKSIAVTEASLRRAFYEDQLKQAKETLIAAELSFQEVQKSKGLVQLETQGKALIEGLADLRAHVAAKQVELQALQSYSTENNPDVQLAERELSSLQAEEYRMGQRDHSSSRFDIGLGDVQGAGMDFLRAEHELKYRQTMFDLLIRQYDVAKLDESKEAAIVEVLEPAIAPEERSSPKRTRIVLGFAAAGLLAGGLWVVVLWWMENVQSDTYSGKRLEDLRRAIVTLRQ